MEDAFRGAENMQMSATDRPDLSAVTSMGSMFSFARVFNGDISGWNVTNVTDMHFMFDGASAFDQDIGSWDVANVTLFTRYRTIQKFDLNSTQTAVAEVFTGNNQGQRPVTGKHLSYSGR